MEETTFGWALTKLRGGHSIRREGWNGKGMKIGLQVPDAHSMNTLPYIFMVTADGSRVPWTASQTDILAADWVIVE